MKVKLTKTQINEKLEVRNIRLIGKYESSRLPAKFQCLLCGRGWLDIARYVIGGNKPCPFCRGDRVSYLYVLDLHDGRSKIGVSNSPYRRCRDFKSRNSLETVSVAFSIPFTNRLEAEGIENMVKGMLYSYLNPEGLIEGTTEVFFLDTRSVIQAIEASQDLMRKFTC